MGKESLIIDGNAVYEMDMDCHLKRLELERETKKNAGDASDKGKPSRTVISIRNVDEQLRDGR